MTSTRLRAGFAALCALSLLAAPATSQLDPAELTVIEIGAGQGGFGGELQPFDGFGASLTGIGDLDGDGRSELAIGAPRDHDGGSFSGAVWILFPAQDGSVASWQKISQLSGGFGGSLGLTARFGSALSAPGDLNGDGIPDLVVGAPTQGPGRIWVLFMNADGSVGSETSIETDPDIEGNLIWYGRAIASPGDVDQDGTPDLIVSALAASFPDGELILLLMNPDGTPRERRLLDFDGTALEGHTVWSDGFGTAIGSAGDVDGNGVPDLAIGSPYDDDGSGFDLGAAWLAFLDADGDVLSVRKLSAASEALSGLGTGDLFGWSLTGVGDLDADGTQELLVGAPGDNDGGSKRGAAWLLSLDANGEISETLKYSSVPGGPFESLMNFGGFGTSVGMALDADMNGQHDVLVGTSSGPLRLLLYPATGEAIAPFVPSPEVFDGKPGRSALVPLVSGNEDFIDEPVVVVSNRTIDTVSVRIGQPIGEDNIFQFHEAGNFSTGNDPHDVGSGSFFDGGSAFAGVSGTLADLVVANNGSDDISLLRALPGGGYAPRVDFSLLPLNAAPVALEVADLNGDGRDDVAVAGEFGLTVFLGDGLGGFPSMTFTPVALRVTDLEVGDLDADGILDVVCTSGRAVTPGQPGEEGFATALLGNGDGSFSASPGFASGRALASVLLADMDQDARLDVLLVSHALMDGPGGLPEGRIELYLGDGLGGFTPSPFYAGHRVPDAQGIHPTLGAIGDLNGDGWLDAIYSSSDSIAFPADTFAQEQPPVVLTVLRNDQLGGFVVKEVGTAYVGKGVAPILADIFLDPEENPDAILVWWENASAGLGDGIEEDLTTFVTAFSATGDGEFVDPSDTQFSTGPGPANAVVADLDSAGDEGGLGGHLDVIVPNLDGDSLTLLFGDGEGGVANSRIIGDLGPFQPGDLPSGDWVGGPRAVEVADTNGDGLGDVIVFIEWVDVSGANENPFASLVLVDMATKSVVQAHVVRRAAGDMGRADVTGDGLQDALVTQRVGPESIEGLLIYPGREDGLFAPNPLTASLPDGWLINGGLAAQDLDADGMDEVVLTITDENGKVRLLTIASEDETPILIDSSLGALSGAVRSVVLGDLDGDGTTDAALGFADGRLRVARGLGGGAFALMQLDALSAAKGGGALALGDVNGDRRLDIVSSTAIDDGVVDQAFVRLLLSEGGGAYAFENVDALQSTGAVGALRPVLADMNHDEALDLVLVHGTSDAVSILINQLSAFESFGSGKPGSGGIVPVLSGTGFTTPGGAFTLHIDQVVGGAMGALMIGFGALELGPLHVETTLLQLPLGFDGNPGVAGAGAASLNLGLPSEPGLVGLELVLQALVLDPGAGFPAPNLAASNGLTLTVVQ